MAVILTWGITRYKECRKEIAIVEELRADNVKIKRLPLTTFEKILGERFTKQSWEVNLDAQPEHLERLSKLERVNSIRARGGDLTNLAAFSKLANLESLELVGAWQLKTLVGIEHLQNLRIFELGDAWRVTTARPLASLKKLEELSFFHHDGNTCSFEDLDEVLHELTGLKSFVAYECPVRSLDAFENCKNLERLELWLDGAGITSLDGLVGLPIQKLDLSDPGEIEDWTPLGSMTELTDLRISTCHTNSLEFLPRLKKLKSLDLSLSHQSLTRDGKTLGEALEPMLLPQLEKLRIPSLELVTLDEKFSLERFTQLRELTIREDRFQGTMEELNAYFADPDKYDLTADWPELKLSRLKNMPSLRKLRLVGVPRLTSLDGIESLGMLNEVQLRGCPDLSDIRMLQQLASLDKVDIFFCQKIPPQQITNLKAASPKTEIIAQ